MTALFLVVLAIAWIAVFLPAVMRAKREAPFSTAERFRKRMELIAPASSGRGGRWVVVPQSHDRLARVSHARGQRRRLRIFIALVAGAVLTFFLAILAGGSVWELNVAIDLSLAAYVSLLIETRRRRLERTMKVRPISTRRALDASPEPARAVGSR